MDNDDAIVGRILSRREALVTVGKAGLLLVTGGGLLGVARGVQTVKPSVHLVATPALTEGPFFVDERLKRSDVTAGTTRTAVTRGLPLLLTFKVYLLQRENYIPLKDVYVDIWQADVLGVYSDESNPMNGENTAHQTWLRGYQVTGSNGTVQFKTIFPGWYPSRTAHIHFKVRTFAGQNNTTSEFTSQLFFRDQDTDIVYARSPYNVRRKRSTTNSTDSVFNERQADGSVAGSHLLLNLREAGSNGFASEFAIVLTDGSDGSAIMPA